MDKGRFCFANKDVIANCMKTAKSTIIWTIIIFIAMTLLTMKQEAASDGFDTYGFPFTFYDNFEGKCDNCSDNFGFKPVLLFADILIISFFAYLIVLFKNKFFKRK